MKKVSSKLIGAGVVGVSAMTAYMLFIRPLHLCWGATRSELELELPGDELVPKPKLNATHAITINAPASAVWSWLVQIGQNRGGFYSYEWLENLVGCHMHNADRIVPEWQELAVGDEIWLHPKAPPLRVLMVEPERFIVLEKCWTFFLQPINEKVTRLIVRGRGDFNPDFRNAILNFIFWRVIFEPAHFIMERKMLLNLKERSETSAKESLSSSRV